MSPGSPAWLATWTEGGAHGRIYYERELAEGRSRKEALRALMRRVSDALYRRLVVEAG